MISTILVPLDGTLLAEQAVPTAMSFARRAHGQMALMLVREQQQHGGLEDWPRAVGYHVGDDYIADQARRWQEAGGATVLSASIEGGVAEAIAARAEEIAADLIVMSTHGRTGLARTLGGSVADGVVRRAKCPVLLLRPPAPGRRASHTPLRLHSILVPLDGSFRSQHVLPIVADLVEPGVTDVFLLEVVRPRESHVVAEEAECQLTTVASSFSARAMVDVYPHVIVDNDPANAIARFAQRYNISLVAMTTRGRGASRLLLGSVADGVLHDSRTPLLLEHAVD